MSYLLVVVGVVLATVYIYGLRPVQRWRTRNFAGPKPKWLVGSVGEVLEKGPPYATLDWSKRFGPEPFAVNLLADAIVYLPDPQAARKALLHCGARTNFMKTSLLPEYLRENTSNNSILLTSGERWKGLRSIWQPIFFTGSLENYMGIMDKLAILLSKEVFKAGQERKVLDIAASLRAMSLNAIANAAFGVDLHTQALDNPKHMDPKEKEMSDRTRTASVNLFTPQLFSKLIMAARALPIFVSLIRLWAAYFPDKTVETVTTSRTDLYMAVKKLVEEHREGLRGSAAESDTAANSGADSTDHQLDTAQRSQNYDVKSADIRKGVQPGSFVDMLVKGEDRETGKPLDEGMIIEQAATMLLAGYETTANTLSFTCYLLAQPANKDKQEKLIREIDALGKEWKPGMADLEEKLTYTDAVIKESLRLFPAIPAINREAVEDIEIGGHAIRQGQTMMIPAFAMHRDPEVWGPDAERFVPERWLDTSVEAEKLRKSNFMAFGLGPRSCPGARFALCEAKVALARLFQRSTLKLAPQQKEPLELQATLTMSPKNGVKVIATPRH